MTDRQFGTRGRHTRNAFRRQDLPTAQAEAAQHGLEVVTRDGDGPWEPLALQTAGAPS